MYTREEGFYGLPRPLRADIQLWIHLVRTCIECNYFNFIAAIEKEIKQKPRNFTEAFIFCFFCILLLFTFYFQDFPASSPSQTPILSDFPGQQPSLPSRLLCILWHPESLSQWRVKLFSSHLLFFGYEERSYLRLYANSLLLTYAIREAHFHSLAFIFMPAESICLLEK